MNYIGKQYYFGGNSTIIMLQDFKLVNKSIMYLVVRKYENGTITFQIMREDFIAKRILNNNMTYIGEADYSVMAKYLLLKNTTPL